MREAERESIRVVKPPKGGPRASAGIDLVIIREIPSDDGVKVRVERAKRGHWFAVPGESFGRYVGEFEYDRMGDPPPDPPLEVGDQDGYLVDMECFAHTLAGEWKNALWPFADQAGQWGDTDVNETDIMVAAEFDGSWMVLGELRFFQKVISSAALAGDCFPTEAEEEG